MKDGTTVSVQRAPDSREHLAGTGGWGGTEGRDNVRNYNGTSKNIKELI